MYRNLIPHGCGENNFPQRIVATQFFEHEQILLRRALHAHVSDSMEVNDTVKQHFVAVGGSEPTGNLAEHLGVTPTCVVEARGIDEVDCSRRRELVRIYINDRRTSYFAQSMACKGKM